MISKLSLLLCMLLLASCGELFMTDESNEDATLTQFATCELDVGAFSYILQKNIKGDIECLKENLHLFMDTVRTDRPGYISKEVLKNFVLNGPLEIDPDTVGIIDSVFDLSHLIIGTEKGYIVRTDVDILLDFMIYFNEHIWKSYELFNSDDDINYSRHLKERDIVYDEFALISKRLAEIYRPDRTDVDSIDTENFLFNFFKDKHKTLENIRSLMFLKRAFLGGEIWDLTHFEFSNALKVLPDLAQVAFDLIKVENYTFADEQETLIKVFLNDIDTLKHRLYFDGDSHEAVFSIYNLINAITTVAPDLLPVDISKYPRELMKIKNVFLGNGGELISARELISAFEHGNNILEEASLFYRIYDFYRDELDSPNPITHDFEDFPVSNSRELEILNNFSRIVHEYKFMKGSFKSPFYTFEYNRNANSYFQISSIEYALKLVMAHYGRANVNARGGYDMTLDQSVEMVGDFKWFLKDQGIVTIGRKGGGEVEGVADNLVLLSTLFQYQSDGCDTDFVCMEAPEVTEFVLGMLTAGGIKDFFTDRMTELCVDDLDQYDRIAPECFRRNFINVIESKLPGSNMAIANYMPFLHKYLKELTSNIDADSPITDSKGYMKFILETEAFTRSCMYYDKAKTDEVYLRVNDAFAVFAGLLNVESTLLRFDLDQNNNIDATNVDGKNEVMNAYYSTYKGALLAMVEGEVNSPFLAKFMAKPIFQYLVKYGEVPDVKNFSSVWRFIKFILKKSRYKKADISRTTVATILRTIGERSENADLHPYKCEECFRDPTVVCLPEGDPWD